MGVIAFCQIGKVVIGEWFTLLFTKPVSSDCAVIIDNGGNNFLLLPVGQVRYL